jgi:fibronectin type 3 domain-containing protein
VTTYTDGSASSTTTYFYRVFARNAVGTTQSSGFTTAPGGNAFPTMTVQSAASNIVGVNLPTPPTAPSNVGATILSATQIRLNWTDNSNNETNFTIQRNGTPIATVGANTTTYTDSTAASNQTYTYGVAAVNAAGTSAFATATITVSAPAATNLLSVTAARTGNSDSMTLVWSNGANATSYNVQRATNSAFTTGVTNFTNVTTTTLANGNKQYVNTNVPRGTPGVTTYWYRVTAVNPIGASVPSNSLSAVTQ